MIHNVSSYAPDSSQVAIFQNKDRPLIPEGVPSKQSHIW